jgi:hypothetical protein
VLSDVGIGASVAELQRSGGRFSLRRMKRSACYSAGNFGSPNLRAVSGFYC